MYKTTSSGLPTPYRIDHSGLLLKIGIYCVCLCRSNAKHQSQTAVDALMASFSPSSPVTLQKLLFRVAFHFMCLNFVALVLLQLAQRIVQLLRDAFGNS